MEMWSKGKSPTVLVGMSIEVAFVEKNMEICQKLKKSDCHKT